MTATAPDRPGEPIRLTARWTFGALIAVLLALSCVVRLMWSLGPRPIYDSDSAAPLLLAQGHGWGAFALFYPGQDRWGAWPFLLARALALTSPEAMHALRVGLLLSSILPLGRLLGSWRTAAVVTLFAVSTHEVLAKNLHEIGQPYAWQFAAVLWSWAFLRTYLSGGSRWSALGLLLASVLACWVSSVSAIALLGLLAVEAVAQWAAKGRILVTAAALLAGPAFEQRVRIDYHQFARAAYGRSYNTPIQLDRGYLLQNAREVTGVGYRLGLPLIFLGVAVLFAFLRRRRDLRTNVVGLAWLSLSSLPVLIVISHVRLNLFAERYFSQTLFFSLCLLAYLAIEAVAEVSRQPTTVVALLALCALALRVPFPKESGLTALRAETRKLLSPTPRVLMDGYWNTYVPATLVPYGALIPLPLQGQTNRFPMFESRLRNGAEVLVECGAAPADNLEQYGVTLARLPGDPIEAFGRRYCLFSPLVKVEPAGSLEPGR
jgi:hypothetical protein